MRPQARASHATDTAEAAGLDSTKPPALAANATHTLMDWLDLCPEGAQYRAQKGRDIGAQKGRDIGVHEGRDIGAYELAVAMEDLGAGEILLNCIDEDGQGNGFDHELVGLVSDAVTIPVIASSGAGKPSHFTDVFEATNCSAALAAGIFHRGEVAISEVKDHMRENGVLTRA